MSRANGLYGRMFLEALTVDRVLPRILTKSHLITTLVLSLMSCLLKHWFDMSSAAGYIYAAYGIN